MSAVESDNDIRAITKLLVAWYDRNRRVLPWREIPTPYRVWVSEVMLQQTRVEAVKPYFERFMKRFPDIRTLSEAPEEELLKHWEGLGYYNRVRNLQAAAIQIVEQFGGEMPADHTRLLSLKGIGSYTAGAIASIAFGIPKAAVDGNVLRVLARIRADGRLMSDPKVRASVEKDLEEAMPKDRPGDFNQALMELGALICVPNGAPHCEECPVKELCRAHCLGKETEFPQKEEKKARKIEEKTILVIRDENRIALHKRPDRGLLAGMYEFPSIQGFCGPKEIVRYLADEGLKVIRVTKLQEYKHIFTHREWHMRGYMVRVDEFDRDRNARNDWIYIEPQETKDRYPIPAAFENYARALSMIRTRELGMDSKNG